MFKFDVALCRTRDNVAHKVRRYKSAVASGFMPDVPEFACLCRNGRQVPAGEGRALVRIHVVRHLSVCAYLHPRRRQESHRQTRPDATAFLRSVGVYLRR